MAAHSSVLSGRVLSGEFWSVLSVAWWATVHAVAKSWT